MSKYEVYYYSQNRWGVAKVVFILCRYLPYAGVAMAAQEAILSSPFGDPTPRVSNDVLVSLSNKGNIIRISSILAAEILFCIRIWILWEKSKRILFTLFAAATVALTATLLFNLEPIVFGLSGSEWHFFADQVSHGAAAVAAVVLTYELALLFIVLLRWRQLRGNIGVETIVGVLVKDGVLYILGVVAISATILIVGFGFSPEYSAMFETFQVTMHSNMACRIMLNLVKNEKDIQDPTVKEEEEEDLGDMAFAAPGGPSSDLPESTA